jgi:hypothetical protein
VASAIVSAKKKAAQLMLAKGAQLRWSQVVGVVKASGLKVSKVQARVSGRVNLNVEGLSGDQGGQLKKKLEGHPAVSKVTRSGGAGSGLLEVTFRSGKGVQFSELAKTVQLVNSSARLADVVFFGPPPAKKAPKPG